MSRKLMFAVLAVAGFAAGGAYASEAAIRKAFQARVEMQPESVTKSHMPGLYEVVAEGQIFYVDEKVNFILRGVMFDARGGSLRNVTAERNNQLTSATLTKSLDSAFRRVRGNGRRVLYTFEDPNCVYCKQLHQELAKMTDLTVYTFLVPILGPDSVEKSRAIWCSKDRARAWDEVMAKGVAPGPVKACDTPFDRNLELARRFGIRGTPAVYLSDGDQIGGYVPAERIEQALRSVSSK
ncbi:MAG: DsbC family protein [Betaproteobacteria bacterium]|nr:DsbC family protein [Betaproteobacteria bacterium]